MAFVALLHLPYVVRPISDHAEVSHSFQLSYINHLTHTQSVCRDGEESLGRLLPIFYVFRAGCSWDCLFNSIWITPWYDLPPRPPEANPNFDSNGTSQPPFR